VLIRAVATPAPLATPRLRRPARRTTRTSGSLYLLVALLVVLNLVGVVMVLSASSVLSLNQFHNPWHYFERQVLWLVVGTLAFIVALRSDYRKWRRLARPAMAVTIALLAAVMVPGVGITVSGATRWIGTSSLQIQPSELAKLALILFAADGPNAGSGASGATRWVPCCWPSSLSPRWSWSSPTWGRRSCWP
jgi:Cell cycle protein